VHDWVEREPVHERPPHGRFERPTKPPPRVATVSQARLGVGPVDDPLEREADRVADRLLLGLANATRIRRNPAGPGVIRRFPIKTATKKTVRLERVDTDDHIETLVELVKSGELDAADLTATFKNAFASAAGAKGGDEEKSRLTAFDDKAWSAVDAAYTEAHKDKPQLTRPELKVGLVKKDFRPTKVKAVPSTVASSMDDSFAGPVALLCDELVAANNKLSFDKDRVAQTLYWFIYESPHGADEGKTDKQGHSDYKGWVAEVRAGIVRWDKLGLNAAVVLGDLFKGLNNKIEKWGTNDAGAMRGKVAEIRDALRPGREANVADMRGGKYQPYQTSDTVGGLVSVPHQQLAHQVDVGKSAAGFTFEADVDRVDVDKHGNEYWIEVKFDAHTATQKHSDPAQLDRLCATVRHADREKPLDKGRRRIPAVSVVSPTGTDEIFRKKAAENYVHFGVHLFLAGEHLTPEGVRRRWKETGGSAEHAMQPLTPLEGDAEFLSALDDARKLKALDGMLALLAEKKAETLGNQSLLAPYVQDLVANTTTQNECMKIVARLSTVRPLPEALWHAVGGGLVLSGTSLTSALDFLASELKPAHFASVLMATIVNLPDHVFGDKLLKAYETTIGPEEKLPAPAKYMLSAWKEGVEERAKRTEKKAALLTTDTSKDKK
jgi:hypothetical protein